MVRRYWLAGNYVCIRVIQRKETPLEALRGTLRRDTEHEHTENRAMTTTPGEHNQPALFPYAQLRTRRSSVKFTRYAEDVLPLSVAEMDFELVPRQHGRCSSRYSESAGAATKVPKGGPR